MGKENARICLPAPTIRSTNRTPYPPLQAATRSPEWAQTLGRLARNFFHRANRHNQKNLQRLRWTAPAFIVMFLSVLSMYSSLAIAATPVLRLRQGWRSMAGAADVRTCSLSGSANGRHELQRLIASGTNYQDC